MKKPLFYIILSLFLYLNSFADGHKAGGTPGKINDGPYIFKMNKKFKVTWVENGIYREDSFNQDNFNDIKKTFNLTFNYKDLTDTYLQKPDLNQSYNMVDSIGVISDIHGEYNVYVNLLKGTGIIDDNLNWKFGKGHLVVLGDVFDRGDMVTEILWHLFGLEKQAEKAGGMVHVMLGNHELLMLSKDLSYISEKYQKVEKLSDTRYYDLYSRNSVLGKWLRSKPVVITINNIIFVHGGISRDVVRRNLTFRHINQMFYNNIIDKDPELICADEELLFLSDTKGPVWYRGYFTESDFCESRLDSILSFYGKKHIVVGHTTSKDIRAYFHNKIFGIDAGISMDQPGEMLLWENGSFYKCYGTGVRFKY
jgi:hypothetical protein